MTNGERQEVKDLGFALWQLNANDKAYKNGLITTPMYEFAKKELQKAVETLSVLCPNIHSETGNEQSHHNIPSDYDATPRL